MRFQNPQNDHVEVVRLAGLWTLLFGSFYFAVKGVWTHFVISLMIAVFTIGISWFIYPFFAKSILRNHYLHKGWKEL